MFLTFSCGLAHPLAGEPNWVALFWIKFVLFLTHEYKLTKKVIWISHFLLASWEWVRCHCLKIKENYSGSLILQCILWHLLFEHLLPWHLVTVVSKHMSSSNCGIQIYFSYGNIAHNFVKTIFIYWDLLKCFITLADSKTIKPYWTDDFCNASKLLYLGDAILGMWSSCWQNRRLVFQLFHFFFHIF